MGAIGRIFGGVKPKPQPAAIYTPPPQQTQSPEDKAAAEQEKKNQALVALNASGGPQGLGDTSEATVTKRKLLGL